MFVFLIIHPSIHPSGYGSNNTTVALVSTSAVSKTPSSSSTDSQHLRQQSGTVLYLISFFFSPEIMERRVPNATLQPYSIYTRAAFAWCLIRHTMRAINKEEEEEEAKSSKKQQRVQQQQKEKPYERECCDALEEPFESQLDLNQSIKGRRYWLLGSLPPSLPPSSPSWFVCFRFRFLRQLTTGPRDADTQAHSRVGSSRVLVFRAPNNGRHLRSCSCSCCVLMLGFIIFPLCPIIMFLFIHLVGAQYVALFT